MSKEPSYVRCIKPNDYKKKGTLNVQTGSCYIGRRGHDHPCVFIKVIDLMKVNSALKKVSQNITSIKLN
jgi:hypothetical protein